MPVLHLVVTVSAQAMMVMVVFLYVDRVGLLVVDRDLDWVGHCLLNRIGYLHGHVDWVGLLNWHLMVCTKKS